MSEEVLNQEQEADTEVNADIQEKLDELERLKAHHSKLLDETKTAKQKAAELEQAQQEAEEARQKEKGEFKSLYEKTVSELESEREQGRKFRQAIQQKELESEAFKLAGQLTKDTKRAELLKKEVLQFASYTDEGVVFEVGGMAIEQDKLIENLKENYPFLVDGSGASGGGAAGGLGGGASKSSGDFGGDRSARKNAIKQRFNLEE